MLCLLQLIRISEYTCCISLNLLNIFCENVVIILGVFLLKKSFSTRQIDPIYFVLTFLNSVTYVFKTMKGPPQREASQPAINRNLKPVAEKGRNSI